MVPGRHVSAYRTVKDRKWLWDATVDGFINRNKLLDDACAEFDDKFAVEAGESGKKIRNFLLASPHWNSDRFLPFQVTKGAALLCTENLIPS